MVSEKGQILASIGQGFARAQTNGQKEKEEMEENFQKKKRFLPLPRRVLYRRSSAFPLKSNTGWVRLQRKEKAKICIEQKLSGTTEGQTPSALRGIGKKINGRKE